MKPTLGHVLCVMLALVAGADAARRLQQTCVA